jgi:hypothetical protein
MIRPLFRVLVTSALLCTAPTAFAQSAQEPKADAYPIIAQLYGNPSQFTGKSIVIYGLVIETAPNGTFMLQDVSQHPIKIVSTRKFKAKVGDQLIVFGIFKSKRFPYVRAKSLIATKVLGGGGCC